MHVPLPFSAIARRVRSGYSYFRTGVHIEGRAHLCDDEHLQIWVGGQPTRKVPQHVDVTAKLWNRRGERVTVIELARAVIPACSVELTPADMWPDFKPVTLEPGAAPVEASFVLVPKNDPKGRVEAADGASLDVEFLPIRGSERWARPRGSGVSSGRATRPTERTTHSARKARSRRPDTGRTPAEDL